MRARLLAASLIFIALCTLLAADGRRKLDSSVPYGEIMNMDPKDVDPSGLKLTAVESMHSTGTYQHVELADWRLSVTGPAASTPLSLTYEELGKMTTVTKRAIIICPGFFYDYLEWEGVPLQSLLAAAGVREWKTASFTSVDGYVGSFSKAEADANLIMVALKGNGVPLPRSQGFPARVVAVDLFGGRWVKYLKEVFVR
jgi:DMSO/TMAO reductase YedYZ molybdopterin-dependent catalytic subunit